MTHSGINLWRITLDVGRNTQSRFLGLNPIARWIFLLAMFASIGACSIDPLLGLQILGVVVAVVFLIMIPVAYLPTLAFLLYVLLDLSRLPFQSTSGAFNVQLLIVSVWIVRRITSHANRVFQRRRILTYLVIALAWWGGVSFLTSINHVTSAVWIANFSALVILPALLMSKREGSIALRAWWQVGTFLAVYAIVESLFQRNPIWGTVLGVRDYLDTVYRATASFSGPNVAGLFFCMTGVLGIELAFRATSKASRVRIGAAVIMNMVAMIFTGTRGSAAALAAGVTIIAIGRIRKYVAQRNTAGTITVVVLLAGLLVGALGATYIYRGGNGSGSARVHERSVATGLYIASRTPVTGYGPGTAYQVKTSTPGPGTDEQRSIEETWIDLYVALGPGVLIVASIFVCCGIMGFFGGGVGVAAALAVYLVQILTFSFLETNKPSMIMLGILVGAAASGGAIRIVPTGGPTPRGVRSGKHAFVN